MTTPLRIVVGDDEPDMRDYLREVLSHMGHEVLAVAGTGAELVDRCKEHAPDLVITDIRMPDMDGVDAAVLINRDRATPMILLSAYHDPETIRRAEDTPVLAYLVKPVKQADLEPAVAIAMRRWEQIQGLRDLSVTDELTQLHNRRGLFAQADMQMKAGRRTSSGFVVILMDVNAFKSINDRFGHPVGDDALRQLADVLRQTFRDSDVIARLGGDEFCVLATEPQIDPDTLLQRLHANLRRYHEERPHLPYRLAVSAGFSRFDPDGDASFETLLARADERLYEEKRLEHARNP